MAAFLRSCVCLCVGLLSPDKFSPMAPKTDKKAPQKARCSQGKTVKTDKAPKRRPKYDAPPPGPSSPWLAVRKSKCATCKQTTHDIDFQSPPTAPMYLRWAKSRVLASGENVPAGEECYFCFAARRRFFMESAQELADAVQEKDSTMAVTFFARRAAKVSGSNEFDKENREDVRRKVRKVESQFKQKFVDATCYKLDAYVKMRKLRYASIPQLLKFIREEQKHRVFEDDDGDLVVEILDGPAGSWRTRRGLDERAEKEKAETFEDKKAQQERFEVLGAKLLGAPLLQERAGDLPESNDGPPVVEGEDTDLDIGEDDDVATKGQPLVAPSVRTGAPAEKVVAPAAVCAPAPSVREASLTRSARSGAASSSVGPTPASLRRPSPAASVRTESGRAAEEERATDEAAEDSAAAEMPTKDQKRKHTYVNTVAGAKELYKKTMMDFGWEGHAASRIKSREFDALVQRLRKGGRKLSSCLGKKDCTELGPKLFHLADEMETRQSLIMDLRTNFTSLLQRALKTEEVAALESCPKPLLCNLATEALHTMAARFGELEMRDNMFYFLEGLRVEQPAAEVRVGLALVAEHRNLCYTSQTTLLATFAEAIWARADASVISAAGAALAKQELQTPSMVWQARDVAEETLTEKGWFQQSTVDLKCLHLLCALFEREKSGSKTALGEDILNIALFVFGSKAALSMRFRALLKAPQPAAMWTIAKGIADTVSQHAAMSKSNIQPMQSFVDQIDGFLAGKDYDGLYNLLAEVLSEDEFHGISVSTFVGAFGHNENEQAPSSFGAGKKECTAVAAQLMNALLQCAETILSQTNRFQRLQGAILHAGASPDVLAQQAPPEAGSLQDGGKETTDIDDDARWLICMHYLLEVLVKFQNPLKPWICEASRVTRLMATLFELLKEYRETVAAGKKQQTLCWS